MNLTMLAQTEPTAVHIVPAILGLIVWLGCVFVAVYLVVLATRFVRAVERIELNLRRNP